MFSFGAPQWILAVYLAAMVIGPPIARYLMIDGGAKGFNSWREYWGKWSADFFGKVALVAILYWGGFWA